MKTPSTVGVALSVSDLLGTTLPRDWTDRVAAVGIDRLELWTPWHVTRETVEAVGHTVAAAGWRVACVSSPSYLHGDDTGRGANLIAESIDIAAALGAPVVNTYFGHGGDGRDNVAVTQYARLLAPLLRRAERAAVTIVLENEFDAFGHDPLHTDVSRRPASLAELVALVGSEAFRLNLDAANFLCAGQDPSAAAALLAAYVGYCHVKDVRAVAMENGPPQGPWSEFSDAGRRFHTTRLGEGDVPWPSVLLALADANYAGSFTLEPHCDRENVPEEAAAAVAYLQAAFHDRASRASAV